MTDFSISDFTALINNQIQAHGDLEDHLVQMEGVFEFMLTADFSQVNTAALQAQLMSIDKLLHEAKTMNEDLQATLVEKVLSQLVDNGKSV